MKDIRRRSFAKFASSLNQEMQSWPLDKTWTKSEVSLMMKDAMVTRSLSCNNHKDQLLTELELVESALKPMEVVKEECQKIANVSATRSALLFLSALTGQFILSQYGTYYALSWDIIEPITACVTLIDMIACYSFWLWAKKPWDMVAFKEFFRERKLAKLYPKYGFNKVKYEQLLRVKSQIKNKLYHKENY